MRSNTWIWIWSRTRHFSLPKVRNGADINNINTSIIRNISTTWEVEVLPAPSTRRSISSRRKPSIALDSQSKSVATRRLSDVSLYKIFISFSFLSLSLDCRIPPARKQTCNPPPLFVTSKRNLYILLLLLLLLLYKHGDACVCVGTRNNQLDQPTRKRVGRNDQLHNHACEIIVMSRTIKVREKRRN